MLRSLRSCPAFFKLALALILPLAAGSASLQAQVTIASNIPPPSPNGIGRARPPGTPAFVGFSFTTAAGGAYDDLTLNLFSDQYTSVASAPGTGYLLSQPYTGTPADLSSSAAGYLGSVAGSAGYYTFGPTLTLQPGVTYYFYENGSSYANVYLHSSPGQFTTLAIASVDFGTTITNASRVFTNDQPTFLLTGDFAPVPEPATCAALAGVATLSLAFWCRRRRAAA